MSSKQQDYTEYTVDLSQLTKERPLGVTGILRCQNSADFLDACIESCIEGLDELIAVYHNCTDETANILKRKQSKYPYKIKIFEYQPYIYPIDLTDEQFQETMNLPKDSIHLLSGYSNYAISKVTYRYAIKIDSDQLFFSESFKKYCDAYRTEQKVRINPLEQIAYKLYTSYLHNFKKDKSPKRKWQDWLAIKMVPFYFSYLKKRIKQDKILISLSGINVLQKNGEWLTFLGDEKIDTIYRDILCPFNGVRDLFFFEVSEEMTYQACYLPKTPGYNQVLEVMFHNKKLFDGGLIWFHLRPCLQKHTETYQYWYEKAKDRFISLEKFKKCNYSKLKRRKNLFIRSRFESMFSYFYSAQRHSIPWRTLENWRQEESQEKMSSLDLGKYKIEFDTIIQEYIRTAIQEYEVRDTLRLMLGNHSIKNALFVYILSFISKEQMDYIRSRIAGKSIEESIHNISNFLNHFEWIEKKRNTTNNFNIDNYLWTKLLSPYKRCCLVYLVDKEELAHISTFLQKEEIPILLLSEYEIPDDTELPETVTAVQVEFSEQKVFENDSIEQNFPRLFLYANTFETILRILNPSKVVCLTSSKTYQKELLLGFAKDLNTKIECW